MAAEPVVHIHLDPVGGIAGDMLVAALVDALPGLEAGIARELARSGLPARHRIGLAGERRCGIAGRRFLVEVEGAPPSGELSAMLERIERSAMDPPVKRRAGAIYRRLGEAEAAVHAVPPERVHFHEIADWDTYADIVAAASAIEALACPSWSVGPLPLGSGLVRTAHGQLPVPAPATARLIAGLAVHDDGLPGERVTPTGAAILVELAPTERPPAGPLRLRASGHGLGARELPGKPNLLRALVFAAASDGAESAREEIAVLRFEIDDQPAEDLALALDTLRGREGVLDACQWPVVGKRGRLATAVQLLCAPSAVEAAVEACLAETSTLGVRVALERRFVLGREILEVGGEAGPIAVKRARRPDGTSSAKAELRDLAAGGGGHAGRSRRRRAAEAAALGERGPEALR